MQAHAADMNNLRDAGLVTDNDALATEVLADRIRLRLEEARGQVDVCRAYMAFLTGHALADGAVPKQAEAPPALSIPAETELLATAKCKRPDRATRELETKASESLARASRGGLRPQALLAAQYEYASPNSLDMPPVSEWKDDMYAGVAVSWNLLDWGLSRAKADEADARFAQAQLRLQQADEQIALEVREAGINLKNAIDRVAVVERAQKSAGRNLDSVTDLWKNGLARHSEVLDAHSKLTDTQTELAAALADIALARAALDHAVGMMRSAGGKESK
jgi:outer membrane protein TolC